MIETILLEDKNMYEKFAERRINLPKTHDPTEIPRRLIRLVCGLCARSACNIRHRSATYAVKTLWVFHHARHAGEGVEMIACKWKRDEDDRALVLVLSRGDLCKIAIFVSCEDINIIKEEEEYTGKARWLGFRD